MASLPDTRLARVAELADALASGASARKGVGVQVPPRAREFEAARICMDPGRFAVWWPVQMCAYRRAGEGRPGLAFQ